MIEKGERHLMSIAKLVNLVQQCPELPQIKTISLPASKEFPKKTTTVVTFQGDAAYHSVSTTDRGDGKPASVFTTDSHWVGPCQAGQVPGEGEMIK